MPLDHFNFIEENKSAPPPPLFMLSILVLILFASMVLGFGVMAGYGMLRNMDFQSMLANLNPDSPPEIRNFIRTNLLINHFFTFVIPAIAFSYYFYKNKWFSSLHINIFPKSSNIIMGGLLILAAFPLAQFALWLNMKIPLPDTFMEMEENTAELISNLLLVKEPYELWFNLLVIAVIPAIGEEFIFRGIIQKKLMNPFKNPHLAIWVAAFIFSAIHFQFQGFFTRMLLGGILGYLFYWTGNLWVAVFAHLVNNAFQIIGQYFFQKGIIDINMDETVMEVDWGATLISLILVVFLSLWFHRKQLTIDN